MAEGVESIIYTRGMADTQPRTPVQSPPRHGFRVEGHEPKPEPKPAPRMPGGRRFWVFLLVLLVANYVIAGLVSSTPSRQQVPYSFFFREVRSGNVSEVTATGDTIQGDFKHAVKAPEDHRQGDHALPDRAAVVLPRLPREAAAEDTAS